MGHFFARYAWRLPIELTPSDQTLDILIRVHKYRSAEFIPLSRVASLAENIDAQVDHIRIKGTNGDLLLGPSKSLSRRTSDFYRSPEAFAFAIRLLMHSYVLVSCADPPSEMRCPLQSAILHMNAVETFARARSRVFSGLRPKLPESEISVRQDWHRVSTAEPTLSLEAIIELVSRRHSIWPSIHAMKPPPITQCYTFTRAS